MSYYVYAIGPKDSGPTKIGFTNDLEKRLRAIQTGNPTKVIIHHYIEFDNEKDMRKAEKALHRTLAHHREKGEWFNILPEEAKLELTFQEMHSD